METEMMDKCAAVKVGDIFYSSWGYDQTNVDWYEVVARTAKCVRVRRIHATTEHRGSGSDRVVPVPGAYLSDKPADLHKLRAGYQGEPTFNPTSYSDAYLWDGASKYQTADGWGH